MKPEHLHWGGALVLLVTAGACVGDGSTSGTGVGSESNPCFANKTCDTGLTCVSDVCVKLDGGATDAPLQEDVSDAAPTCDGNLCGSMCVDDFQTNAAHCGRCDHSCLGGLCSAGACLPVQLAMGQGNGGAIAVNATTVYWTLLESLGPWIKSVPIDGGSTTTIATSTNVDGGALYGGANGVVLDSTSVYWTVGNNNNLVMKAPLGGGPNVVLTGGQANPAIIVATATTLYWPNFNYSGNNVESVSIDGGVATVIAPNQSNPGSIAIDASNIYWVNYALSGQSTVMKYPLIGGSPTLIATDTSNGASGIAVDSANVYWTNNVTGRINKVSVNGGTITSIASGQSAPAFVAVDATWVYWTNPGDGTVAAVSTTGGTPKTIASNQTKVSGMTIDAVAVYWTTGLGTIMKVAKP